MPASTAISTRSPVNRVRAFEQGLLALLRNQNADILDDIRKTGDLTDATAGKLKARGRRLRQDVRLSGQSQRTRRAMA